MSNIVFASSGPARQDYTNAGQIAGTGLGLQGAKPAAIAA
jgi:hypothetical protein